ncbi:hypothetical protein D1872_284940 [compost metagenome]
MFLFLKIMNKAVFLQIAEGNLDNLFSVRHDNVLFRDQIGQVLLDDLSDLLLVPLLILVAFAVQRPILFGNDKIGFVRLKR